MIERNARTRFGELDIVALDGATLVFIEVKTLRAGNRSGPLAGLDAIGPRKQRRVRRLARAWLGEQAGIGGRHYDSIRFDAVGVHVSADGRRARIEHVPAAF